jgi:hypothetical protein
MYLLIYIFLVIFHYFFVFLHDLKNIFSYAKYFVYDSNENPVVLILMTQPIFSLNKSIFMRGSWRMPNVDWPNNFDITTSTLR